MSQTFTVPTGAKLENLGDGQFLVTHPDGTVETVAVWMEPGVGATFVAEPTDEKGNSDAS